MLAIGGGSVIDTAKLLGSLPKQQHDAFSIITGMEKITPEGTPLVGVPTTSGSGSEATQYSTVYYEKDKYSVCHPSLVPAYVILAPELSSSLPAKLTAITGLDAICQAIESLWAVNSDAKSVRFAKLALSFLLPTIRTAVQNPDKESRNAMICGAHYAGCAINISRTTAPHAYSYTLTSNYDIPHGHAVAVMLPVFLKLTAEAKAGDCRGEVGFELLQERLKLIYSNLGGGDLGESLNFWQQLLKDFGLGGNLSSLGIKKRQDLEMIASNVNLERLGNHPTRLNGDEVIAEISV